MSRAIYSIVIVLAFSLALFAQDNANTQKGFLPYGSYQEGGIDSVSLSSGALILHAPFYSLPQRGSLTMNLFLGSNSKGYRLQYECDNTGIDCLWYWRGGPTGVQIGWDQAYEEDPVAVYEWRNSQLWPSYTRADVMTPDGGNHHLMYTGSVATSELRSFDGSGIRSSAVGGDAPASGIFDRYGNYHSANNGSAPPVVLAEDPNGNQIIWQGGLPPAPPVISDTLGRTMIWPIYPIGSESYFVYRLGIATSDFSGCTGPLPITSATLWTLPGAVNGSYPVKLCYAKASILSNFPAGDVQVQATGETLQSIVLPNGTAWSFEYNSRSPGDPPNVNYGDLTKITLPTGGTISYSWDNLSLCGSSITDLSRVVTSRTIDANDGTGPHTFTYAYSFSTGPALTTTVTDPQGNQSIHAFTVFAVPNNCTYYETRAQDFQGSSAAGVVLKTVTTDYQSTSVDITTDPNFSSVAWAVQPIRTTTTWPNGQNSKVEQDYSNDFPLPSATSSHGSVGTIAARREYDYGSSTPTRTTTYSYLYQSNPAYFSRNIVERATVQTVIASNGSTAAQTINTYDSTGVQSDLGGAPNHDGNFSTVYTTRGNLTQVQHWLNPGNTYMTTSTNYYDDLGNLRQTTDARGYSTTFDYSDSWWGGGNCVPGGYNTQAYLRQVTNALNYQEQYDYYYPCTGLLAHTRDTNDLANSRNGTIFTYDFLNRPLQVTRTDGGQTNYFYNDNLASFPNFYIDRQDLIDSASNTWAESWTGFDGIGRVNRTAKRNGEPGANITDQGDTCYDALGRKSFVRYPYQGPGWNSSSYPCSNSSSTPGDTFTYDAMGRVTQVTNADGSTVITDYSQFPIVTVTDQAGKRRRSQTDAFGRLIAVWEPDANGNFTYETDYQYDTLDNLVRVDQKGGDPSPANWRTRLFSYDSLSRLLSTTNPESGTITYAYDNASNLISKIAPAPNQTGTATLTTTYGYDALNRLTGKSYSSGGGVVYVYDQSTLWGISIQNGWGRLSSEYNYAATGNGDSVGFLNSYDPLGRTVYQLQFNQRIPTQVNKEFRYAYNLDGSLKTVTYPSGRLVTYTYNKAQRPISAANTATTFATGAHYTAWGALSSVVNSGMTTTDYYNLRMQPCRLATNSAGVVSSSNPCTDSTNLGNVLDLGYDFNSCNGNGGNNGNVCRLINNKIGQSARSQSFQYDALNRLLSATSANWNQSYTYDIWGNLYKKTVGGTVVPPDAALDLTVNGVSTINNKNQAAQNWCYDAAGNIVDPNQPCPATPPSSYSNVYDGENRLTYATVGGLTSSYDYDADGLRVKKTGSTNTLYWYGPGGEVLEETDLNGNLQNEYVFFGGKRTARYNATSGYTFYFSDHLGSADVVTDALGNIKEESDYYPFGGERIITDLGIGNNYKFTGKERDTETGCDYFGARYYCNPIGRFLTPDKPFADQHPANPQSWNLYTYTRNNPLKFIDDTGEGAQLAKSAAVNAALSSDPTFNSVLLAANNFSPGGFEDALNSGSLSNLNEGAGNTLRGLAGEATVIDHIREEGDGPAPSPIDLPDVHPDIGVRMQNSPLFPVAPQLLNVATASNPVGLGNDITLSPTIYVRYVEVKSGVSASSFSTGVDQAVATAAAINKAGKSGSAISTLVVDATAWGKLKPGQRADLITRAQAGGAYIQVQLGLAGEARDRAQNLINKVQNARDEIDRE
jgi:RHS repeat-associated protein